MNFDVVPNRTLMEANNHFEGLISLQHHQNLPLIIKATQLLFWQQLSLFLSSAILKQIQQ